MSRSANMSSSSYSQLSPMSTLSSNHRGGAGGSMTTDSSTTYLSGQGTDGCRFFLKMCQLLNLSVDLCMIVTRNSSWLVFTRTVATLYRVQQTWRFRVSMGNVLTLKVRKALHSECMLEFYGSVSMSLVVIIVLLLSFLLLSYRRKLALPHTDYRGRDAHRECCHEKAVREQRLL